LRGSRPIRGTLQGGLKTCGGATVLSVGRATLLLGRPATSVELPGSTPVPRGQGAEAQARGCRETHRRAAVQAKESEETHLAITSFAFTHHN
jgi:hypothetical protein